MSKKKQKLRPVEFNVPRNSRDETTFAVVRAKVSEGWLCDADKFANAVRRAVTLWVQKTKEGKAALESASDDFNIGDLAQEGISRSLAKELNKQGIYGMSIETHSQGQGHGWEYDDHLFNEDELTTCQKCGSELEDNGKCSDVTCPYSDRFQDETYTEG